MKLVIKKPSEKIKRPECMFQFLRIKLLFYCILKNKNIKILFSESLTNFNLGDN
jgi:hypothetical protein